MGQTGRFLEMVDAEKDHYRDVTEKIERVVFGLCHGKPEKISAVLREIWGLQQSAQELYEYIWSELEPELKKDDSELLVLTKEFVALTLLSEVHKWLSPKKPIPD